MARAFGIVTSSGTHIKVEGLQQYRPIGAFSFLGRYRVIDFPISNMSNSGIDRIQVYVNQTTFTGRASRNRTPLQHQLQTWQAAADVLSEQFRK